MTQIETGIPTFDKISGGGLPIPSAIALIGNVGSAKEIFARQIVWNFLQKGSKVLYYSISQSAEDLRTDMNRFNWDVTQYEKKGLLHIEDIFTITLEHMSEKDVNKDLYDLKHIALVGMKFMPSVSIKSKPRLIIFDSVSPIISTNTKGFSQMIHALRFATRLTNTIGIGLMHTRVHEGGLEETFKSLADGIIEINGTLDRSSSISLSKYVGEYKKGYFPLEINSEGIKIIPIVMVEFSY